MSKQKLTPDQYRELRKAQGQKLAAQNRARRLLALAQTLDAPISRPENLSYETRMEQTIRDIHRLDEDIRELEAVVYKDNSKEGDLKK